MKSKVLIFPDKIHTRMRLIEAAVAAVFLTFILAIGALDEVIDAIRESLKKNKKFA
jgi:hypothetical protein